MLVIHVSDPTLLKKFDTPEGGLLARSNVPKVGNEPVNELISGESVGLSRDSQTRMTLQTEQEGTHEDL